MLDSERVGTAGRKAVNKDLWQALLKGLKKKGGLCSFGRFLGNGMRIRRRRCWRVINSDKVLME